MRKDGVIGILGYERLWLFTRARLEFDNEKRKQIYWRWQELVHEKQPVTFLYYQMQPAAFSKRFRNMQWLPLRPGMT